MHVMRRNWWIAGVLAFMISGTTGGCSCQGEVMTVGEAGPEADALSIDTTLIDVGPDAPRGPHITYVKASNTERGDLFGWAGAISADGNTIAIGADGEASTAQGINGDQSSNLGGYAGAVYVYTRSGATWVQQAYVKGSNTAASHDFGSALALSADGNTLAVGAYGEYGASTGINQSQAEGNYAQAGAVYVLVRTGGVWTQQAYVKASNTGVQDYFGWSVALSADGDTLAVGASHEASSAVGVGGDQLDNSADLSGAVYVFRRAGATWAQQAYIKSSNTELADYFGGHVALSGDGQSLAVGAQGESSGVPGNQADNSVPYAGAVYVFRSLAGTWTQDAYLKAPYPSIEDAFGYGLAFSFSGRTLAIASQWDDSASRGIGGDAQDNAAENSGAVYVFERLASGWAQQAFLKSSNSDTEDYFGTSVSLAPSGDLLVVGTRGEGSVSRGFSGLPLDNSQPGSGAAYVFRRASGTWSETQYLKASNTTLGCGGFGTAVGISADGKTILVTSAGEASLSTGIDGDQTQIVNNQLAGAAYIFEQ